MFYQNLSQSLRKFNLYNKKVKKVKNQADKEKKLLLKEYKDLLNLKRIPYGFGQKSLLYIKQEINSEKEKINNEYIESAINNVKGVYNINHNQLTKILKNLKLNKDYDYILKNELKQYKRVDYDFIYEFLNNININSVKMFDKMTESDGDAPEEFIKKSSTFEFIVTDKPTKKRVGGAYFGYYNLTDFNLKAYGIFSEEEANNTPEELYMNCLERSLKSYGLTDNELSNCVSTVLNIKNVSYNDFIGLCHLKNIFKSLKLNYTITRQENTKINTRKTIINKDWPTVPLGLINNHYFLNEKILVPEKDLNKNSKSKKILKMTTYKLIDHLVLNKDTMLKEITINNIKDYRYDLYNKKKDFNFTDLTYDEEQCTQLINGKKNQKHPEIFTSIDKNNNIIEEKFEVVYFDFEAYVDSSYYYTPFMISYSYRGYENINTLIGSNCALNFLKSIKSNTLCIAHNLAYDIQFLIKYLDNLNNYIKVGNKVMSISGRFYNKDTCKYVNLMFKDSYSLITAPLSKFGSMFNLQISKAILPYDLYNSNNCNKASVKLTEALKYIKDNEQKEFIEAAKPYLNNNNFYHIEYCKYYCELDVQVLKDGYEIFKNWLDELTNINVDLVYSQASLGYAYMQNFGCLDGTYKLSGLPRVFIQNCVVGGRVMTRDNEKQHTKHEINDIDAVSLYPASINRLPGYLLGKPKVINTFEPEKYTHYFIKIKVIKINKHLHFPLLSKVNENGIRMFSNDLEGEYIYLDKYTLEDTIKYQKLEYEFIQGYYFDEGYNSKCKKFIETLFNQRLEYKKNKNPAEQVFKLIMNSCYGKTIEKCHETNYSFVYGQEKFLKTFSYNSTISNIKSATEITPGLFLLEKVANRNEHFSSPHIGSVILSMSKRIMNEVMCLAEDNNINIWYQDTDSMHIDDHSIDDLTYLFKEKYNRDLIGKNLGQFHSDFTVADSKGKISSIEAIFLGKKCYIDKLKYFDNDDNEKFAYHVRMKGIPSKSIIENLHDHHTNNPLDLYKALLNGDKVKFDLNASCIMQRDKDFKYKAIAAFARDNNTDGFIRELSF